MGYSISKVAMEIGFSPTTISRVYRKYQESGKTSNLRRRCDRADRRVVLLARWIVRSEPLEIVGCSGHEKVPTRGKPGLDRPGRPRGERIEGSFSKHLWIPQ
ncbi:hypothetical protein TNCV_3352351 [Trichonephila clavipes]|nr:hypothetical protein TNCV_3352351 [Trichonephila clavipes]